MTGETIAPAQPRANAPACPADFEQLVADYAPRIRRLAFRLLGWRHEADDIVQDVFLAALENAAKLRDPALVGPWLVRVTINRCRTHRRRNLLRLRWLTRRRNDREGYAAADAKSLADETSARVQTAVANLRPKDREVIVLFYLENLPANEIAHLLGQSRGAIEVRLHRARAQLRESLSDLMRN